jgi:hypothetical protein
MKKTTCDKLLHASSCATPASWSGGPVLSSRPDHVSWFLFCQVAPGFHFFGFRNNNYFFNKARSSALRRTPNLEDQVPVFISPRDMVAQLWSQALGSLFVASYNSQGYGEGILTALHAGTNGTILSQIGHDHFLPHSFNLLFTPKIWKLPAGLHDATSQKRADIKFSSWQLDFASTVSHTRHTSFTFRTLVARWGGGGGHHVQSK